MYIEPAEYLDLSDRLSITTNKLQRVSTQKQILTAKVITLQQKVALLQSRVKQLESQKQKQNQTLKEHITAKTQNVITHISTTKEDEKTFIQQQIDKLRNQSALNKLNILEQRISENKLTSTQKQFCQKLKTLYVINKKKSNCNFNQLYDWISGIINNASQNKQSQIDILSGVNNSSKILAEDNNSLHKNLKKSKKQIKNQILTGLPLQTIDQRAENVSSQKNNKGKQNMQSNPAVEKNKSQVSQRKKNKQNKQTNPLSFLLNI